MTFIRPQQDLDSPKIKEGYYIATVIDNNDPNKLNRVKIRIVELHGNNNDIPDSSLPWAIQFKPNFLGGDKNLSFSSIPRIGSNLIVTHINGDIYQPAYLFELNHLNSKINKIEDNYPNSYILTDDKGNFWHINLDQNKLDIKFNGSKFLEITSNYEKTIGGDENSTIEGSKNLTVPIFNINCSGSVNIDSPSINVNGGTITVNGGDVIADGISLKTHTHGGISPGGSSTGIPQ